MTDVEVVELLETLRATIAALEKRVAVLEHFEHGHCQRCGKVTRPGSMTYCPPDTPCPKVRAA